MISNLEELMEKSTYWSSVAGLCKWTWSDQFRRFQGSILLFLASGKIKEGELIEKVDWKRLEQWFRSCRKVSYGASMVGRFWLFKLEKTNGIAHVFIGEANEIKRKGEWCNLEGIRLGLHHEESVTSLLSKLIQNARFNALIHLGKLANHF